MQLPSGIAAKELSSCAGRWDTFEDQSGTLYECPLPACAMVAGGFCGLAFATHPLSDWVVEHLCTTYSSISANME